jgi:hypothetical protein
MTATIVESRALQHERSKASLVQAGIQASTCLAVCLLPIGSIVAGADWDVPYVMIIDLLMMIAALLGAIQLLTTGLPSSWLGRFGLIYLAGQTTSLCFTPTVTGAMQLMRLAASYVFILELADASEDRRRRLERILIVVGVVEVGVVLFHHVTRRAISEHFIEFSHVPFSRMDPTIPMGSFQQQYVLSAFFLVIGAVAVSGLLRGSITTNWLVLAMLPCGFFASSSVGRNATAGAVFLVVCLLVIALRNSDLRIRSAVGIVALLVGIGAGFFSQKHLWAGRTVDLKAATTVNGRDGLNQQALKLWKSAPATGVGLGNYLPKLRAVETPDPAAPLLPVHDYPLWVLAETGVVGVLCGLPLFGLLLCRVRKRGLLDLLPFAALAPLLLLDILFGFFANGMMLLAVAIGLFANREFTLPATPRQTSRGAVTTG